MKKLVITLICLFALSTVGLASPLLNYDKGSVSFEYTYRPSLDIKAGAELNANIGSLPPINLGISKDFDGSANMELGLTFGIGNNWALQYRQYNPEGTIWSPKIGNTTVSLDGKIRQDEYNLLYKFTPKAAVFIGAVRANGGIKIGISNPNLGISIPELRSDDMSILQFGLLGSTAIGKKLNAYGMVSMGSCYRNWEAGLSYGFTKDLEFNLSYRDTKWDRFKYLGVTTPGPLHSLEVNAKGIEAKGWGFGLTYKF